MCDYSLMEVPNRLAEEGESLQVFAFPTGTKGLVAQTPPYRSFWQQVKDFFAKEPDAPPCAVCIPPGARLTLHNISATIQRQFEVQGTEEVTFTQLHADAGYHRDAVSFSNGQTLSLQRLLSGQSVDVLRLSLAEDDETFAPAFTASMYELMSR